MTSPLKHCPKIIRGTWQLSQSHTGSSAPEPLEAIMDAIRLGLNRFDTADIYTGAEAALGRAIAQAKREGLEAIVHTKFVPDLDLLQTITHADVEAIIDRSLSRLGIECLPLVQFHWWDFSVPRYLEVLSYLTRLQEAGKIGAIGVTNFDAATLKATLNEGIECVSVQCQVSLLDHRAEKTLRPLCHRHGLKIFSYGTLAGGFLSDLWLGKPEPRKEQLPNRSLVKYQLIIDDWGGWQRFQAYLTRLRAIADCYNSSIAQIARVAILQSSRADSIIVGMSRSNWSAQNRELAGDEAIVLSSEDLAEIFSWSSPLKGDVYALERDRAGPHGSIMKYNLNADVALS